MQRRPNTLVIPPKTRLLSVERVFVPYQRGWDWAIWIETNNNELQKPHEQRQGTYLRLYANAGAIDRVTVDGYDERILRVME